MPKIFIVTPLANEEATIARQLEAIAALGIPGLEAVFVMDNYSRDRTRGIIENYAEKWPWVHLCFYPESTGVVSSYLKGMKVALEKGAEWIVEMDAGLSHDPADIIRFLAILEEGYECVFGSRFISGGGFEGLPWIRRLISRFGTVLANVLLGTRLTDMTSGFEAFRSEVLTRLDLDAFLSLATTHFYQTEMRYYCSQLKMCEIPIVFHGSSTSLKPGELGRSLKALFRLRSRRPLEADRFLRK